MGKLAAPVRADKEMMFTNRQLVALMWPLLLEQLLAITVGLADSLMVATVGDAAISAVSLVDSISNLMIYIFSAMATGGAAVAGQYIGQRQKEDACNAGQQLIALLGAVSIFFVALLYLFRTQILTVMFGHIEPDVMAATNTYYLYVMASIPGIALYNGGAALFRTMGHSDVSLKVSLLMNSINVIGNAVLIFGFGMDVAGVAIPTLVSRTVAAVVILSLLFDRDLMLHLSDIRGFDWSVEPRYFTFQQLNPANLVSRSRTMSSVRLSFSPTVYNPATGSNINAGVYAVRMKGPGLPASGVVYAPFGTSAGGFTILNKTGVIPAEGTVSTRAQADFRIAGVYHPSGGALAASDWPGGATTGNLPHYTDTQLTDFSALQAFSRYTVEIYKTGSTQPIVEQTTILAPVEAPSAYVQRPLHDLSPSAAIVTPPQGTATSVTAAWVRNPLAVRIDSAYFFSVASGVQSTTGANLPDANALTQTSTSITIPTTAAQAPAFSGTVRFDSREVGLTGRAARASFQQSVLWGVP